MLNKVICICICILATAILQSFERRSLCSSSAYALEGLEVTATEMINRVSALIQAYNDV